MMNAGGVKMDASVELERECSALGFLFQQIITDMKNGTPLWEDFISKATKLHTCLKTAIVAISAFLEAFQKIADAATNARGATKEIGTALTRICLRHKAVETRVKSITNSIMDCLVVPLQEKLEDWKKSLVYLDKEHAKEYKKAKTELKKKSCDTLRLQKKKIRKGLQQQQIYGTLPHNINQSNTCNFAADSELGKLLESSTAIVQEKRATLEETERKAVRAALLEERGRFCQFARFLKPVLDEELSMLMELTHLQEVADQLQKHVGSPNHLPPASEQVILDVKGRDVPQWALATPPSSPSLSLGSRKSSVCSINSLTSSSSGSCKSHPSPSTGHPSSTWHRNISQQHFNGMLTLRYQRSISSGSRDSGFTSLQENHYLKPSYNIKVPLTMAQSDNNQKQLSAQTELHNSNTSNERPHTISSAYEKAAHHRPALSVYTFQTPEQNSSCQSQPASPVSTATSNTTHNSKLQHRKNSSGSINKEKPPVPNRCSSLERPSFPTRVDADNRSESPRGKIKLPIPAHIAKELSSHQLQQPMYVNMHELANLAASKAQEMLPPPPPPPTEENSTAASNNSKESKISEKFNPESKPDIERIIPSSILQRRASFNQPKSATLTVARRSSSISSGSDDRGENQNEELDNLPPPPAFLLEGSSPPSSQSSPAVHRRSVSVFETVRTLTELKHTPASPSLLRRKVTFQSNPQTHFNSGEEKSLTKACNTGSSVFQMAFCTREKLNSISSVQQITHSSPDRRNSSNNDIQGPGGVAQSFMAALSAKLTNSVASGGGSDGTGSLGNSPKFPRKLSAGDQQNILNKNSKASSGFLETLNARLTQQHNIQARLNSGNISLRSAGVRRMMANRVPIIDPIQVRGSLMDQIKKGTSLRKTSGPINDHSAPKIY